MADEKHLTRVMQGVNVWNEWRQQNPEIIPDLSRIDFNNRFFIGTELNQIGIAGVNLPGVNFVNTDLSGSNLAGANFTQANLSGANFSGVNLTGAKLIEANLSSSKFTRANLFGVHLVRANLQSADFSGANLSRAELIQSNLLGANFVGANLTGAGLTAVQAIFTDFENAILTGACLEDWHINSETKLDGVICEYVYLKNAQQERRPYSRNFKQGEFTKLYQKALETADIVFLDGIDWKAFLVSFLELKSQSGSDEISIQSFENRNGAFIVRINVPLDADKAEVEKFVEEKYQLVLKSKDEEILFLREEIAYKRQENTKIIGIIETMAEKENSKKEYTFHAPVGSVENQGHIASSGNQNTIGNAAGEAKAEQKSIQHIHNYVLEQKQTLAETAAEIQELLKQLQTQGYSPEAAQQKVASDLAIKAKSNPTFKEKLVKWGQYLGDAAANGLIGEAVVTVLKLALQSQGFPIP